MTREEIAQVLKRSRGSAGFTQKQVAQAIGRKQQTVASWETAQSQPDVDTLFGLFDLYGISIDDAFGFNQKERGLSPLDRSLIAAFRNNPDMQVSVLRLLQIESEASDTVRVYRAAKSEEKAEGDIVEMSRLLHEKLKAAKPAEQI